MSPCKIAWSTNVVPRRSTAHGGAPVSRAIWTNRFAAAANRVRLRGVCPLLVVLAATIGCGDGGPERIRLTGTVTHQGKPVPVGTIVFTPDTARGNSGPQGAATIRDGAFDTDDEGGRSPVQGPHVVTISGYDGVPTNPDDSSGTPLFEGHTEKLDITPELGEYKIDIP